MGWVVYTGDPLDSRLVAASSAFPIRSNSLDSLRSPITSTAQAAERQQSPTQQPPQQPWLLGRQSAPNPRAGVGQQAELSAWLDRMMLPPSAGDAGGKRVGRRQNKGTGGLDEGGKGWQEAHSGLEVVRVLRRVDFAKGDGVGEGSDGGGGRGVDELKHGGGTVGGSGLGEDRHGIGWDQLRLQQGEGMTV